MKTNNVDFGKSFKFKHKNADKDNDAIYTYSKMPSGDSAQVTWPKTRDFNSGSSEYSLEEASDMVERGLWIVLPTDMKEIVGDVGPGIIYPFEKPLLDQIKDFTATSNHSIFIHDGYFEVYQAGLTEFPYKCADDETLKKVMAALKVLDGVGHD